MTECISEYGYICFHISNMSLVMYKNGGFEVDVRMLTVFGVFYTKNKSIVSSYGLEDSNVVCFSYKNGLVHVLH